MKLNNSNEMKRFFFPVFMIILFLALIIPHSNLQYKGVSGHSAIAQPIEIFSFWDNSDPLIDGTINFDNEDNTSDWYSALIYDLYDSSNVPKGKVFLQNDDIHLNIAFDLPGFQEENPIQKWGANFYFDINHNGIFDIIDRSIGFISNVSGDYVLIKQPKSSHSDWEIIETGLLGTVLSVSGVLLDTAFTNSTYGDLEHRQYEVYIPLSFLNTNPGGLIGVGFEASDRIILDTRSITWPHDTVSSFIFRTDPSLWGDLYLGEQFTDIDFVIEENFNIKPEAVGVNDGIFLATGNIDSDPELELIVSSNKSSVLDSNLTAIYEYDNGQLVQKWASWKSSHSAKSFLVRGLATHDFDKDGEDEIYFVGEDKRIGRLHSWSDLSNDFDSFEFIYNDPSGNLMGYIDIGNVLNNVNQSQSIVFSNSKGNYGVLRYDENLHQFELLNNSLFEPNNIEGQSISRVHEIIIGNADSETNQELLFWSQYTSDNSLSHTRLQIMEYFAGNVSYPANFYDNGELSFGEDNLSLNSSSITQGQFGHTIIVADVDNDLQNEIITVGKNYLKIFGANNFTDSEPPLTLLLNDNTVLPHMAGGAIVGDITGDGENELVIGSNNGTVFILKITDNGYDSFSYNVLWKNDLGSSPGKRNSLIIFDMDQDGENELIFGDNHGQIIILGKGNSPQVEIQSPLSGSTTKDGIINIDWDLMEPALGILYFELEVNTNLYAKLHGSFRGYLTGLSIGSNNVTIIAYDVSGKVGVDTVFVDYLPDAPMITITSPSSILVTRESIIEIEYQAIDDDFEYYMIYLNESILTSNTLLTSYQISLPSEGVWNVTVVAIDSVGLTNKDTLIVIRDLHSPEFTGSPLLDNSVIQNSTEIEIVPNEDNQYTISITIEDEYGISAAYLNIISSGFNASIPMILNSTYGDSFYVYTTTIDLDSYQEGTYQFNFIVYDLAGNVVSKTFDVTIVFGNVFTSFWNQYKLFIIIGSIAGFLLIISTMFFLTTGRSYFANKDWKEAIEAIAYVSKPGLTLAYIPYSKDLSVDEQLFGGAMTGILGILEEISGQSDIDNKAHIMEYGDKQFIIYSGMLGNTILLVTKAAPILKKLTKQFTNELELAYAHQIEENISILDGYTEIIEMAAGYFGQPRVFDET